MQTHGNYRRFFIISGIAAQIFIPFSKSWPLIFKSLPSCGYQSFGDTPEPVPCGKAAITVHCSLCLPWVPDSLKKEDFPFRVSGESGTQGTLCLRTNVFSRITFSSCFNQDEENCRSAYSKNVHLRTNTFFGQLSIDFGHLNSKTVQSRGSYYAQTKN